MALRDCFPSATAIPQLSTPALTEDNEPNTFTSPPPDHQPAPTAARGVLSTSAPASVMPNATELLRTLTPASANAVTRTGFQHTSGGTAVSRSPCDMLSKTIAPTQAAPVDSGTTTLPAPQQSALQNGSQPNRLDTTPPLPSTHVQDLTDNRKKQLRTQQCFGCRGQLSPQRRKGAPMK